MSDLQEFIKMEKESQKNFKTFSKQASERGSESKLIEEELSMEEGELSLIDWINSFDDSYCVLVSKLPSASNTANY
jgi:hypothetical protein